MWAWAPGSQPAAGRIPTFQRTQRVLPAPRLGPRAPKQETRAFACPVAPCPGRERNWADGGGPFSCNWTTWQVNMTPGAGGGFRACLCMQERSGKKWILAACMAITALADDTARVRRFHADLRSAGQKIVPNTTWDSISSFTWIGNWAVSYTHLTLPTICSV